MSASRARKIMLAAIAVSLLVHLLLAGYIRWPFASPSNEPVIVHVRRITIARAVPHTPPPPTPAPRLVPTPHPVPAASAVQRKVVPPPIAPRGSSGPAAVRTAAPAAASSVTPRATPAPTPVPTAVAAQPCMQHDITPAIAATAAPIDIPPEARAAKANGTAAIHVQIDPQGRVTSASVSQSSGNGGLDAVAVEMARGATYTPALVKCKPVASAYTFTVKFVAW